MQKIIIAITILLLVWHPRESIGQAKINGGADYSQYIPIPLNPAINIVGSGIFTMDDFLNGKDYRINITANAPYIAQYLSMAVNGVTIASGSTFTWGTGQSFEITFNVPSNTATGLVQRIDFEIEKKNIFWTRQTTFHYYINTTCPQSVTLGTSATPLTGQDYEVSGDLTVANSVKPNGGIAEFDAGYWVELQPQFQTDMSAGGAVNIIIEGCGGSNKPSGNSSGNSLSINSVSTETKMMNIFPNPAGNQASISIPDAIPEKEVSITICDINGRLVARENKLYRENISFDVSLLQPGIYMVRATQNDHEYYQKLVKQ